MRPAETAQRAVVVCATLSNRCPRLLQSVCIKPFRLLPSEHDEQDKCVSSGALL